MAKVTVTENLEQRKDGDLSNCLYEFPSKRWFVGVEFIVC